MYRHVACRYVGLSLMLFQQLTGEPTMLYYTTLIFQGAGFVSAQQASSVTLLLGVSKLLFTTIAAFTVDLVSRYTPNPEPKP
jgi:hypothetical protein